MIDGARHRNSTMSRVPSRMLLTSACALCASGGSGRNTTLITASGMSASDRIAPPSTAEPPRSVCSSTRPKDRVELLRDKRLGDPALKSMLKSSMVYRTTAEARGPARRTPLHLRRLAESDVGNAAQENRSHDRQGDQEGHVRTDGTPHPTSPTPNVATHRDSIAEEQSHRGVRRDADEQQHQRLLADAGWPVHDVGEEADQEGVPLDAGLGKDARRKAENSNS
jgi:hypothetical protein